MELLCDSIFEYWYRCTNVRGTSRNSKELGGAYGPVDSYPGRELAPYVDIQGDPLRYRYGKHCFMLGY